MYIACNPYNPLYSMEKNTYYTIQKYTVYFSNIRTKKYFNMNVIYKRKLTKKLLFLPINISFNKTNHLLIIILNFVLKCRL